MNQTNPNLFTVLKTVFFFSEKYKNHKIQRIRTVFRKYQNSVLGFKNMNQTCPLFLFPFMKLGTKYLLSPLISSISNPQDMSLWAQTQHIFLILKCFKKTELGSPFHSKNLFWPLEMPSIQENSAYIPVHLHDQIVVDGFWK